MSEWRDERCTRWMGCCNSPVSDLYSPMKRLVRYRTVRADFPTSLAPTTATRSGPDCTLLVRSSFMITWQHWSPSTTFLLFAAAFLFADFLMYVFKSSNIHRGRQEKLWFTFGAILKALKSTGLKGGVDSGLMHCLITDGPDHTLTTRLDHRSARVTPDWLCVCVCVCMGL